MVFLLLHITMLQPCRVVKVLLYRTVKLSLRYKAMVSHQQMLNVLVQRTISRRLLPLSKANLLFLHIVELSTQAALHTVTCFDSFIRFFQGFLYNVG
jgi:hypothetical protein